MRPALYRATRSRSRGDAVARTGEMQCAGRDGTEPGRRTRCQRRDLLYGCGASSVASAKSSPSMSSPRLRTARNGLNRLWNICSRD